MRILLILSFFLAITPKLLLAAPTNPPADNANDQGYALGWKLGEIIRSKHHSININRITSGLADALHGSPCQMSKERIDALAKELEEESNLTVEERSLRDQQKTEPRSTRSSDDDLGYALGWKLGKTVKTRHPFINPERVPSGVDDLMKGKAPQIPLDRIDALSKDIAERSKISPEEQQNLYDQKRAAIATQNEKEGRAFLAKNKLEKGVATTNSGLQYTILRTGNGPIPKKNDYVSIDFQGSFINGQEFDSTYKRGRPYEGFVDKTIPGWAEILQIMPVGSKYRVHLPPELAYGDEGNGPIVTPKATLIYELELLSIHQNPTLDIANHANIFLSQIDLSDMEKSAGSFMKLYTGISPEYTKNDLSTICQTISTESYQVLCVDTLSKRLSHLQGMTGLKKATFSDKKSLLMDTEQKTVIVSWQEQLTLTNAQTMTTLELIQIQFVEANSLWKITNITKPANKLPKPAK